MSAVEVEQLNRLDLDQIRSRFSTKADKITVYRSPTAQPPLTSEILFSMGCCAVLGGLTYPRLPELRGINDVNNENVNKIIAPGSVFWTIRSRVIQEEKG